MAEPGFDWRAIGSGAADGIAGAPLLDVPFHVSPIEVARHGEWLSYVLNYGGARVAAATPSPMTWRVGAHG